MRKIIILSVWFSSIFILNYFLLVPTIVYAEDNFCSGVQQDLNTHVNNQVDNRLNQAAPNTGLDIYSYRGTNNYSDVPSVDKPWKRNPDSWVQKLSPLDFTGVSGWNDDVMNRVSGEYHNHWSPYTGGATLITPRHFITAEHFKLYPGSTVIFFNKDGKPIKRKVLDIISVGDSYKSLLDQGSDINVGLLDSDIDPSIMSYSILESSTLLAYLQGNNAILKHTPIVVFNQFAKAFIRNIFAINLDTNTVAHEQYLSGPQKDYSSSLVVGDSGQPGFIIINNEPVLLFVNRYPGGAPLLGSYIDKIDLAINNLNQKYGVSGSYSIKRYNSSCFIKYPILNKSVTLDKSYGYVGDTVSVQVSNFPFNLTLSSIGFGQLKGSYIFVPTISSVANQMAVFKIPQIDPGNYQVIVGDLAVNFQVLKEEKVEVPDSAQAEVKQTVSYVPVTSTVYIPDPIVKPSVVNNPVIISTSSPTIVPTTSPSVSASPKPSSSSSVYPSPNKPVTSVSASSTPTPRPVSTYTPTPSVTSISTPRLIPVQTVVYVPVVSTSSPTPSYSPKNLPKMLVDDPETKKTAPTVSNVSVSDITKDSATLTGFISDTGGINILSRGFEYGYSSTNEMSVSETGSFGSGNFSVKLTGLSCGSIYKFRVFAKNSIGLAYSAERTFTTTNCPLYYTPSSSVSTSVGNFSSGTRSVNIPVVQGGAINTNLGNNVGDSGVVRTNTISSSVQPVKVDDVLSLKIEIKRNLKIGDSGQDVKLLQVLLNVLGYKVAETGPGSIGKETTVFDKNTELALIKYQKDHLDSGLKETGIADNVSLILINSELNKIYSANNNSTTTLDGPNNSVFDLPAYIINYISKIIEAIYSKIRL